MEQLALGVDSRFVSMFVAAVSIRNQVGNELAIGPGKAGTFPPGDTRPAIVRQRLPELPRFFWASAL
jgi:hypothetical protein